LTRSDGYVPSTPTTKITKLDDLYEYLHAAMQLEHATLPPYLTALYSIHPGTNSAAYHVIRVVVIEEMLHLTLSANVLNAVGGSPDLTRAGFVPTYPASLPDGEKDFTVDLQPFSKDAVETFLKIERPKKAPDEASRLQPRRPMAVQLLAASVTQPDYQYYSIGEFYAEIGRGLEYLEGEARQNGTTIFTGESARQVKPEYYYSGGGEVIPVDSLESALDAVNLIAEQGEGLGGKIYDTEDELAHYFRFEQLKLGKYYKVGDNPGEPTGPPVEFDWNAVFPVKKNARLADYPEGSELHSAAVDFNESYADFLAFLTRAYTGQPDLLIEAVARMFRIRDTMTRLIHNPIPGLDGVHAAPTFEVASVGAGVGS
jgi:hypothetical protein